MEISLRKSKAVLEALQAKLNSIDMSTSVELNEFENHVIVMETAKAKFHENMDMYLKVSLAIHEIRDSVCGANSSCGINSLLTSLAYSEKNIKMYSGFSKLKVSMSDVLITGKLNKIREQSGGDNNMYHTPPSTVSTTLFNELDIEYFESLLNKWKKNKIELQDNLLSLNITTNIKLSSNTESIVYNMV